ncbi:MAG TPA: hypothetical protein VIM41_07925 [Gammaproteobacteria bacterium]
MTEKAILTNGFDLLLAGPPAMLPEAAAAPPMVITMGLTSRKIWRLARYPRQSGTVTVGLSGIRSVMGKYQLRVSREQTDSLKLTRQTSRGDGRA